MHRVCPRGVAAFVLMNSWLCLAVPAVARERSGAAPRTVRPAPDVTAEMLYSRRARRREATLLRLKLLELRKAHLERARAVIERKLSIDELLRETR